MSNKIATRAYVLSAGMANVCRDNTEGWQERRKSGGRIHMEMQSSADFLVGTVANIVKF